MIPWTDFVSRSYNPWDHAYQLSLHEEWLVQLEQGPSMAEFVLGSPMLELAHERQFVITQQGGHNDGFEMEHTKRIDCCLETLDRHFRHHASDLEIDTTSKPEVPYVGLWALGQPCDIAQSLHIPLPSTEISSTSTWYHHGTSPPPTPPMLSSHSLDRHRRPSVPPPIPEVDESHDELDEETWRSFVAERDMRESRAYLKGLSRARKSIRQRRRDFSKSAIPSQFGKVQPEPCQKVNESPACEAYATPATSPAPFRMQYAACDNEPHSQNFTFSLDTRGQSLHRTSSTNHT